MINFREIKISDAETILNWRTSERVTKFMNTDIKYDLTQQVKWLHKSFYIPTFYHWIIQYGGKDVGLLNFIDWQQDKKTTSWGFYIGEEEALGIGGLVAPYFYNFAFEFLRVNKILAEVFYNNIDLINLHLKQGYSFNIKKSHIIKKNGQEIVVLGMLLEKNVFKQSKFSRLKTEFPINLWKANPNAT